MKAYLPVVIVALCFGIYFLYISPDVSEIKGLVAKKAEYENVLSKAKDVSAKTDSILSQYNNIPQDEIDKLNKVIPSTYDSVMFANDINNIALQYGLTVKSLTDGVSNVSRTDSTTSDTTQPPYKTNVVTMTISGNYDSFVGFLSNLETSLRLVDVTALSIKSAKDPKTLADIFEFTLTVTVYSLN